MKILHCDITSSSPTATALANGVHYKITARSLLGLAKDCARLDGLETTAEAMTDLLAVHEQQLQPERFPAYVG